MTRSAGAACRALFALSLLAAPAAAATYEEWVDMMREKGVTDLSREGYAQWQAQQGTQGSSGQGPKTAKAVTPGTTPSPSEAERLKRQALAAAGAGSGEAGVSGGGPGVTAPPAAPPSASGALDRRDAQGRTGDQRMERAARRFSEVMGEDARRAEGVDELGGAGPAAAPPPGGSAARRPRGFDFSSAGRGLAPAAPGGTAAPAGAGPGSLRAVQASAVGGPFRDMGLRAARGADGQETVLRADGTPASPEQVRELRRRLEREPRALMQRPDFFDVLPRPQFEELRRDFIDRPGMRGTVFKDVAAAMPGARDFQWSRSCSPLDGDCNANASRGRYEAGRYVAPEDLRKMALAARGEKAAEEGAKAGEAKTAGAKADAAKPPARARRTQEFWDRLAKEDEEFQKKLEAEEAAASGVRKPRSGMGRLLDELAASLSAGGASDEGGRAEAEPSGAARASAQEGAIPGRLGSDALRARRPPAVVPRGQGAQRRRAWTAGVVAALALLLGLWTRRRV